MLRHLIRNKAGQGTAEYALLIALAIAGVVAMTQQTTRAFNARIETATKYMTENTNTIGNVYQYEPLSTVSNYEVVSDVETAKRAGAGTQAYDESSNRVRKAGGSSNQTYNTDAVLGTGNAIRGGL